LNAKKKHGDKGVSGLPLFQYSAKRKLERLGVVDVGSNSVRLVIFDGAARSPAYFFNEKILCGLGAGVLTTGYLNPEGRVRALLALKRFALLAQGMNATPLYGVATAAVREAKDGKEFCQEVLGETGISLKIASGRAEAKLSAQGVLLGWPGARGLMCDIGGASLEVAEISSGKVGLCQTSPLGPLHLDRFGDDAAAMGAHVRKVLGDLRTKIDGHYDCLFLVGGSWRAIARLDMERRNYPLKVLHEYEMTPRSINETVEWIGSRTVDALIALSGSSPERMRLVPKARIVLRELVGVFAPKMIAVSSYGIREGLLYARMSPKLRNRDPLIEACRYMERASARLPGAGRRLFDFLQPVFAGADPQRLRLIRAACLLHDVTWRAHPDYRAEVCFDNATRANLGGLNHAGRVFLGLALLHRYKNASYGAGFDQVIGLLNAEETKSARTLGKAMRFGAMLSGASPKMMGRLVLDRNERTLELHLKPKARDLFGEVVLTRFQSLARSLECEGRVVID